MYPNNVQQIYPSVRFEEPVELETAPRIIPKEPLQEISTRIAAEYPHLGLCRSFKQRAVYFETEPLLQTLLFTRTG